MQVVHPICCGLDGHQARLTACLRHVNDAGQVTTEWREFGTIYSELLAQPFQYDDLCAMSLAVETCLPF